MAKNNNRYDLSDRLVHFFRPVDLMQAGAPAWPEDTGYASVSENALLKPQFLLRHAVRMGRLYATWSVRNNRRTVHGHRPAVCFTEMPIPAFIEAARIRAAAGEAISPYGVVLPKASAFSVGARPVIYGLSKDAYATGGTNDTPRLFDKADLPLAEQYRYVAYNPTTGKLDWSHEREWRWPLNSKPLKIVDGIPPDHSDSIPGLNLDDPALAGLGVLVATTEEAEQIAYDVLTKVDRGDITKDHYQFVVAHEAVKDWVGLREQGKLEKAIQDNLIDLSDFFVQPKATTKSLVSRFDTLASEILGKSKAAIGEAGGCWLWLLDNTHPMARALVSKGRVTFNKDGKYLVPIDISQGHNLQQREKIATVLAKVLKQKTGLRANYFSVLHSEDPDDLPFFNGDELDDRLFYNWN